jgi:transcriptional regulator with XRE-family HTH domain
MGSTDFATWLTEEVNKRQWSFRELGRKANLSSGAVSRVLTEASLPRWEFCKRIADALDIPPEQVFQLAGLLPLKQEDDPVVEQIKHVAGELPEEQQRLLLNIARTMLDGK